MARSGSENFAGFGNCAWRDFAHVCYLRSVVVIVDSLGESVP